MFLNTCSPFFTWYTWSAVTIMWTWDICVQKQSCSTKGAKRCFLFSSPIDYCNRVKSKDASMEHQQKKRTWNHIGVVHSLSLMQPAAQQQHDKRLDSIIITKRILAEPSLLLYFSSDVIHNVWRAVAKPAVQQTYCLDSVACANKTSCSIYNQQLPWMCTTTAIT